MGKTTSHQMSAQRTSDNLILPVYHRGKNVFTIPLRFTAKTRGTPASLFSDLNGYMFEPMWRATGSTESASHFLCFLLYSTPWG